MTGIEPWISGAGSDRFGNCVTTTAQPLTVYLSSFHNAKTNIAQN